MKDFSTRFNTIRNLVDRKRTKPSTSSDAPSNSASDMSPRALRTELYVSAAFNGEGEKAKRNFATWRREWKEAEKALKARKASAADFFNRLQPALEGKALQMAREFGDRQDPYQEAMNRLHRVFGDEVELALEHVKPVKDTDKALDAAENAWARFADQESTLQQRGLELQDLLWQQVALRILPAHLEPQKRWDAIDGLKNNARHSTKARPLDRRRPSRKVSLTTSQRFPLCPAPSRVPRGTPR
jgi:hypothetical protein